MPTLTTDEWSRADYEETGETSLASLWSDQDKSTEARELLEPVYDWFTDGFGTVDLQMARNIFPNGGVCQG